MLGHLPSLGSPVADHTERAMRVLGMLERLEGSVYHKLSELRGAREGALGDALIADLVRDLYLLGLYSGHLQAEIEAGAFPRRPASTPGLTHHGAAVGLVGTGKTLAAQIHSIVKRNL